MQSDGENVRDFVGGLCASVYKGDRKRVFALLGLVPWAVASCVLRLSAAQERADLLVKDVIDADGRDGLEEVGRDAPVQRCDALLARDLADAVDDAVVALRDVGFVLGDADALHLKSRAHDLEGVTAGSEKREERRGKREERRGKREERRGKRRKGKNVETLMACWYLKGGPA